jgi:hypothetical protein
MKKMMERLLAKMDANQDGRQPIRNERRIYSMGEAKIEVNQ